MLRSPIFLVVAAWVIFWAIVHFGCGTWGRGDRTLSIAFSEATR